MKVILKVENMMCEGCERRIENALEGLVKADHKKGEVEVLDNKKLEEIKEKLEELGFNVK